MQVETEKDEGEGKGKVKVIYYKCDGCGSELAYNIRNHHIPVRKFRVVHFYPEGDTPWAMKNTVKLLICSPCYTKMMGTMKTVEDLEKEWREKAKTGGGQ